MQVFRGYLVIDTIEATLEQATKVLDAVGTGGALRILPGRVVYGSVLEVLIQALIAPMLIGIDSGADLHMFAHNGLNRRLLAVGHGSSHYATVTLKDTQHGRLFCSTLGSRCALVRVLALLRSTYVRLVNLHRSGEHCWCFILQHFANAAQYEPCGFLRGAGELGKVHRRATFGGITGQVDRNELYAKWELGILKNTAHSDRKFLLARPLFALVTLAPFDGIGTHDTVERAARHTALHPA